MLVLVFTSVIDIIAVLLRYDRFLCESNAPSSLSNFNKIRFSDSLPAGSRVILLT
jgi:hypothetical protein